MASLQLTQNHLFVPLAQSRLLKYSPDYKQLARHRGRGRIITTGCTICTIHTTLHNFAQLCTIFHNFAQLCTILQISASRLGPPWCEIFSILCFVGDVEHALMRWVLFIISIACPSINLIYSELVVASSSCSIR